MFRSFTRSARATILAATAISFVASGVASAQDYPPPPQQSDRYAPPPRDAGPPQNYQDGQQGYQSGPQGYQDGQQGYQGGPQDYPPPPPRGYDGTRPPPPPPGYAPEPDYDAQQGQDQRYEAYAEDWAQRYCVRSGGNVGAGVVIGGLFGALLGSSIAGRHDRGAGAFVGGVAGAVGGAAIASSGDGATSPGCPPGYVVERGAPAFYYDGPGPYYYDAPGWYRPWIFIGGRWSFRPYPYHAYYFRHYGAGRPGYGYRGGYGRPTYRNGPHRHH